MTKGGYSGYGPHGSERCPKAPEHHENTHRLNSTHTNTDGHTHTHARTHGAESDITQAVACVVSVYLINYEYCGYFCIVQGACQREEKPIVQRNVVCLLCGNAGNANFNKKTNYTSIYNFLPPIQIDSQALGKLSSASSACCDTQTTEVFIGLKITF